MLTLPMGPLAKILWKRRRVSTFGVNAGKSKISENRDKVEGSSVVDRDYLDHEYRYLLSHRF